MFFYQSAGVFAGFWLPAGLSVSLLAFLPVSGCLLASLSVCRRFCRFLAACWPFCQSAGVSAGLWLPAGLSASLPAFLPLFVCLLAFLPVFGCLLVFVLCSIRLGLLGDSRLPFSLFACAWCFFVAGHIATH